MDPFKLPHTRIYFFSDNREGGVVVPQDEYDRLSAGMGQRLGTFEVTDCFNSRKTFYWEDICSVEEWSQESLDKLADQQVTQKQNSITGD